LYRATVALEVAINQVHVGFRLNVTLEQLLSLLHGILMLQFAHMELRVVDLGVNKGEDAAEA